MPPVEGGCNAGAEGDDESGREGNDENGNSSTELKAVVLVVAVLVDLRRVLFLLLG